MNAREGVLRPFAHFGDDVLEGRNAGDDTLSGAGGEPRSAARLHDDPPLRRSGRTSRVDAAEIDGKPGGTKRAAMVREMAVWSVGMRGVVAMGLIVTLASPAEAARPRSKRPLKRPAPAAHKAAASAPAPVAPSPAPAAEPSPAPAPLPASVEPATPSPTRSPPPPALSPPLLHDEPPPAPAAPAPIAYALDTGRPSPDAVAGTPARGGRDEIHCLIGELCVGPILALGAVNAFGVGAHARYGHYLGAGFDYQVTPSIGGAALRIGTSSFTVAARVYPFGNGLFLSAGIGRQNVRVFASDSGVGVDASAVATGVALGLGYMGGNGLVIGIDASLLVPLQTANVAIVGVTGVPSGQAFAIARSRAEERANAIAQDVPVVPQVNLLRIGYLF